MAPKPVDAEVAQNRRARFAVAALFLSNGALFANLLPRYPEIKSDLHLSNTVYGVAIAAFYQGPTFAAVQNLAPPQMRAVASGILLFITTMIGYALGPPTIGWLNDHAFAHHGDAAVQYSLAVVDNLDRRGPFVRVHANHHTPHRCFSLVSNRRVVDEEGSATSSWADP